VAHLGRNPLAKLHLPTPKESPTPKEKKWKKNKKIKDTKFSASHWSHGSRSLKESIFIGNLVGSLFFGTPQVEKLEQKKKL